MATKQFNPAKLADLLKDIQNLAPTLPLLMQTISDLVALFGPTPVLKATQSLKGCTDPCQCCECAIQCQLQALAAVIQCSQCCTPQNP